MALNNAIRVVCKICCGWHGILKIQDVGGASMDENECVEAWRDILILIAEIGEMARAGYRGRTRTVTSGIASSLQSTRLVPVTTL